MRPVAIFPYYSAATGTSSGLAQRYYRPSHARRRPWRSYEHNTRFSMLSWEKGGRFASVSKIGRCGNPEGSQRNRECENKTRFRRRPYIQREFIKPCAIYNKIFISPPLSSNIIFTLTLNKPSKQNEFDEFHQKPQQISQNSFFKRARNKMYI